LVRESRIKFVEVARYTRSVVSLSVKPLSICAAIVVLLCTTALATVADGILLVETRSGGSPVSGARVHTAAREGFTDSTGRVSIELAAGSHHVQVTAEGYLPLEIDVLIEAGQETRLLADLTPEPEIEDEIIIRASRTNRRLEEQPIRVEVVDREDIEEKALMTPGSVAMLLTETTGLRIQTTAPSTGAANLRIQGLRGRYSQVLSDGLPLYGLQGNSLSLLQVPPLDLGQVEIIKGAASALYGPSALGGVVNLVSLEPYRRHRELLVNGSTQEAGDLIFWMVEPPKGNWAYTVIGGVHGQGRNDLDKDGWSDLASYRRGVVRPRIFWTGKDGRRLFATFGAMAENRRGGTMPGATTPAGVSFSQTIDTRRVDGGVVTEIPFGESRILSARGALAYQGEDRLFGQAVDRGRRLNWFGETVVQGQTNRHVWVVGGALQQELYENRDYPAFDYNHTIPALIAQDDLTLTEHLTLGVSGRIDGHSEYGTFASPRISLFYKPSPKWTARLSAGTGFFAPTPFVEEVEEVGLSRLRPTQGLVAEEARSISFDTTWSQGGLEFVVTFFRSIVRNPVEREFVGGDGIVLVNATEPLRTWGTELIASYRSKGFLALATHNYTFSTENDPLTGGRRDVPLNPRHSASANIIWEGDWGRIGLESYYVGRQPLEYNPYRSIGRSYVLVGTLAEKRFGSVRLFINLENLTNVRQTNWDPLVRRSPLPDGRWTVDAWAPLDGRVINAGVRVFF
jgi:outer membrane receptor for ferrienterochelin and colicins